MDETTNSEVQAAPVETELKPPYLDIRIKSFRRQGDFWHAEGVSIVGMNMSSHAEFSRARLAAGKDPFILAARGTRAKLWLNGDMSDVALQVNNIVAVESMEKGQGSLHTAHMDPAVWEEIRASAYPKARNPSTAAKPHIVRGDKPKKRVVTSDIVRSDDDPLSASPASNARSKAYNLGAANARAVRDYYASLADEDAENLPKPPKLGPDYFWYREAVGVVQKWRRDGRAKLEESIAAELEASQAWLAKWEPLAEWWNENVAVTREEFQEELGFEDWDGYHPPLKPGRVSFQPKDLYRQERWRTSMLGRRLREDIDDMVERVSLLRGGDYTAGAEEAVSRIGLVEVEDSDDWNDGYLWFEHPDNPGVLFPYCLIWVKTVSDSWNLNMRMIERSGKRPENLTQKEAWYYLNTFLNGGTHRSVDPGWDPRKNFLSYKHGYNGARLEVHYKAALKRVLAAAERTMPPVLLPGMEGFEL